MEKSIKELLEFLQIIEEGSSEEDELEQEIKLLQKTYNSAKIDLFLCGPYDASHAFITITAGPGGHDANDWAQMLLHMYLKYGERKGWKTNILEKSDADVGIKSTTLFFSGENVYGFLKSEKGTHRLVRKSPFNTTNSRETSFATVDIVPEIETNEIPLEKKDLRIDTYRSQGAGGQHVNTTDSAVRITHIPTGLVATCQNQRSQIQNRETALKVLSAKVAEHIRMQEEEKRKTLQTKKSNASFGGGHIRSYVLDDRYVKDVRTGYKSSQPEKVLSGELDPFIEAFLGNSSK